MESYDRDGPQKQNLADDRPYMDLLETVDTIDGMHAGFPCGSFSMVRNRPGGPPPVRSREFPYGLPTNDVLQQKEADTGTVLAVRSSMLASKVLDNHRKRKVGEGGNIRESTGFRSRPRLPCMASSRDRGLLEGLPSARCIFQLVHLHAGQVSMAEASTLVGSLARP